jgi:glucosylglycerate synthase
MAAKQMADESILSDDFIRQLIDVGEVDILVGVPTHNDAKTVAPAMRAIQEGIVKTFPRERAVILNADGGSNDGTPDVIMGASIDDLHRSFNGYTLRTLHAISTRYGNNPSSAAALRTILAAAELLRAKACTVICPESANIEAEGVANLLRPIYRDHFDFVAPIYRRHKFEGILLTNLLYPMTRALFGQRVREPYASEFAFSGRLASQFLNRHQWSEESKDYDPELELTVTALSDGCRICQTFLGTRSPTKRQSRDLVDAMRQTVGVLFSSLDATFSIWSGKTASQPVPTNGPEFELSVDPLRINRKQLKEMFSAGVLELESVLKSILSSATLSELQQLARADEDDFRFHPELWVKTVYEFAASYHNAVMSRDHIVQALVPLYRGRMFTFLVENRTASAVEVGNNIENLCLDFERLKPYLLELWNGRK